MNLFNMSPKHGGGVGESERHHEVLEMAQRGVESSLPFVPLSNPHQMVCIPKVQFRKNLGRVEKGEGCVKERP